MKVTSLAAGLFMAGALLSASAAWADNTPYVVKQSEPSEGSHIKKPIVVAGDIPLDKRYDELTPEQKKSLNDIYEKMGAGDEPPFPLKGLMPLYRGLADTHEKLGLEFKGPVTMYVQVDSQGNAGALYLVEAPDPQIGQAVANILATQKFKPALCAGTPCSMRYVFHADLVGPDWKPGAATSTIYKIRDQ
jgi:hypothetical protein